MKILMELKKVLKKQLKTKKRYSTLILFLVFIVITVSNSCSMIQVPKKEQFLEFNTVSTIINNEDTIFNGKVFLNKDTLFYINQKDIFNNCINRKFPIYILNQNSSSISNIDCNGIRIKDKFYTLVQTKEKSNLKVIIKHSIVDNYDSHPNYNWGVRLFLIDFKSKNIRLIRQTKDNSIILKPYFVYNK